jgi:hypothetical protein
MAAVVGRVVLTRERIGADGIVAGADAPGELDADVGGWCFWEYCY